MDVFDAQVEEGQKNDDGLLLIPGNVVDDGQVVDIVQAEDFLEFEGDEGQGVGVVALAGVKNSGNAAYISEIQLVVLVLCAAGGQDDDVLRKSFSKFRIVLSGFLMSVS